MQLKLKVFVVAICSIIVFNCGKKNDYTYTIAHYNVENLFDTFDDPLINDQDFLPEGNQKWTLERYQKKLKDLARVLDTLNADILSVCEVENIKVMQDLAKQPQIAKYKYKVAHINSPDARGIDVGFLYKSKAMKVLTLTAIPVTKPENSNFKTRDILWMKARLSSGDTVHFFSNHWPSRREGEEESRPNRILAAKALRKVIDGIYKENSNANIVIGGDFNDMPNDLTISLYLGADADGTGNGKLVNPFLPMYEAGDGSYKYKNEWNMLDQLIISTSLYNTSNKLSYIPNSAKVFRAPFMEDKNPKYLGNPFRTYAGKNYLGGYSDHFPVLIKLKAQ